MKITRSHKLLSVVGALTLAVSLSACGSSSNNSSSAGSASPPTAAASVDPSLAAAVPSAIKSAGTISIGTDSTYAPNEFLDTDGKTVIGMDVDLFNAVAAKLGLKTQWQSAMVSYFSAGTQWGQKAGGSVNPDAACGKKIAVQTGTVQVDDVTARSKKCTSAGQPAIKIDQFQAQSDATAAVVSGKDDAMLADSPVIAYAVKQTNGQLALLGQIYESAPYGYVLPKDQTAFGTAIAGAVKQLIADGTYNKILTKWGVQAGAITNPTVNPKS